MVVSLLHQPPGGSAALLRSNVLVLQCAQCSLNRMKATSAKWFQFLNLISFLF